MQTFLNLFIGERFAVKEFHHEFFVGFRNHFHEFAVEFFNVRFHRCGSGDFFVGKVKCLACENVHSADHLAAFHNRKFDGNHTLIFCHDGSCRAHEVTVVFVNSIDENECGHSLFLAKFESLFSADGNRTGCAGDDDCAVCCVQSGNHFAFEIEKSGSVENVYLGVAVNRITERQRN